ncbi:MAG TPA: non-canonical purine NTP pyrophosphatase [Rickettsiales bacterium]|nr:non-canonical purine NTP pyrophosphatase [Rickettsiales bacterium]
MKTIVLASNNSNKIAEISKLLSEFGIEVKSLKDLGLGDPIENGKTFTENALIKSNFAFEKTGLPSLADDSGFCVDSLNGFPGLCSARFAKACGSYEESFKIINECINPINKKANFITTLSFIYKNSTGQRIEKIFEGKLDGNFTYPAKGTNGFGYCPCFTPNDYLETFGEMLDEQRMKINHRAIALNKFIDFIKTLI